MRLFPRAREPSHVFARLGIVVIAVFFISALGTLPAVASAPASASICALSSPTGISDTAIITMAHTDLFGNTGTQPFYCRARAPDVSGQVLALASQHYYLLYLQAYQTLTCECAAVATATGQNYTTNFGTNMMPSNSGAIQWAYSDLSGVTDIGGHFIGNF